MLNNEGMLIFGSSGLIGSYLFDLFKKQNRKVIGTYYTNKKPDLFYFDITKSYINNLPLKQIKYAIICSAITKLDACKNNPRYSHLVNVKSLERIIIDLSQKKIIPIFMSGATVFDGIKGGYKEEDKRSPISIYGQQKVEVEDFIISNIKDYLIIRLGKVFGVKKKESILFTKWFEKYQKGEEIFCADDERISPTYAGDVARGIELLLLKGSRGVFHLNFPKYFSRFELANHFFDYLGIKDAKIIRCSIDDFNFSEKRAKRPYLDSTKFIKETGFKFTPLENCYDVIKIL